MPTFSLAACGIYAAIIGLLAVVLTVRVIRGRVRTGVQAGDCGHAALAQAIRAHANLAEQAPLALILLALVEASGMPVLMIHGLGAVLVVGRFASAWGLSRSLGPTPPRQMGAGLTLLVIAVSSATILFRIFLPR